MLFSKNDPHKLILLLEIQSSLVQGALVLFPGEDKPQILVSQIMDVPYKPKATTAYYLGTTIRDLKEMIGILLQNLHRISQGGKEFRIPGRVDEVHYILSSPWIVSQARTVTASFDADTAISEDRVNKILAHERERVGIDKKIEIDTLEEKIFDVRLNGYSIESWRGKSARELEISYALSAGSRDSMRRLRDIAGDGAGTRKIYFHSSLLLQYISLQSGNIPEDSYTLIHVHGELTDLVVVKERSCSFFGSFPLGANAIMRKIAEATNTDYKTAESLLSLYLGNHIEESHGKKVSLVINNLASRWTDELGKLWEAGDIGDDLPETVFIKAREHGDFFEKSFSAAHPRAKIGKLEVDMTSTYALAIHSMEK